MVKTILMTGATDGIGLGATRRLAALGHRILLHGRSTAKLDDAARVVHDESPGAAIETFVADLSVPAAVDRLADDVAATVDHLDVIVNNAGVFVTSTPVTPKGLDVRFVVNAIAPYRLTLALLPLVGTTGRVVNVASAGQAPVDLDALAGKRSLGDIEAYSQSKLALIMWTRHLAQRLGDAGPTVVAVNPGSRLATKMVREAFGVEGRDVGLGAGIVVRAALDEEFAANSGGYYDNDAGRFSSPHPDALDPTQVEGVIEAIESIAGRQDDPSPG